MLAVNEYVKVEEKISGTPDLIWAMSGSMQTIYLALVRNGRMKPQDLTRKTKLSARTVRHALQMLRDRALVIQIPDLTDLRSHYYKISS